MLPGVTISLKSPEALGDFTAVTDSNGAYRVTNLPPATYDVRAELTGFQSVIRKAPVRLNDVTEVDFTLPVGAVSETVTVTAESPIVDPERAGLSVNINNQALTSVPVTTSRRFQDAWLVVPGVAVNPATQELTGSERRTSLDGADVTDPYGGDIFAVNLNYDAIQDVEVKALGAEASDGSSMVGQYMNIVTKSGGNIFHGSAALFVIPQQFNDSNVQGIPVNQREDYQPISRSADRSSGTGCGFSGLPARPDQPDVQQRAAAGPAARQSLVHEGDRAGPGNHRLQVSLA